MHSISFKSYGVIVGVEANTAELRHEAMAVARNSLLGKLKPVRSKRAYVTFRLEQHGPQTYRMTVNGEALSGATRSKRKFLKFFDAVLRASVGEYAHDLVFLHAGVVGWKGRAIVMPADSFKGKSTITAELVRRGAAYYSDDFAIIDQEGLVNAFPRTISMRDDDFRPLDLDPASLGAAKDQPPIPVGCVLFTEFKPKSRWKPLISTAGQGALEMVPFALSFRRHPEFCLRVLNLIASRAIIASSPRGTAEEFAPLILDFVDKNVN